MITPVFRLYLYWPPTEDYVGTGRGISFLLIPWGPGELKKKKKKDQYNI